MDSQFAPRRTVAAVSTEHTTDTGTHHGPGTTNTMNNIIEPTDSRTEDYWTVHNTSSPTELTSTIVDAVATVTGDDPLELPNLREIINPDALNELFVHSERSNVQVRFEYAGCEVIVTGSGQISIYQW